MDQNLYALELMVRDRLKQARAEAALHALVARSRPPRPRSRLRARLGLVLIRLGRWVRGAEPGASPALTRV